MFRNAFADVYEAVTGQKYYAAKLLTTKEVVREEADNLQEAWKKDRALNRLGVAVILTHRYLLKAYLSRAVGQQGAKP